MSVIAAIVQFRGPGGQPSSAAEAQIGVSYVLFDDAVPVTEEIALDVVAGLTFANRGQWKDLIVAAIIADAATRGRTLTATEVQWPTWEGGDRKLAVLAAHWQKDITKTNLPSTMTNVYVGALGEAQLVNFARYTQYRLVFYGNKIGTGNLSHQLAENGSANVMAGATYTGAVGEFSADTDWGNLPAWATGERVVRPQAASTVATDDPIYRQILLYLR